MYLEQLWWYELIFVYDKWSVLPVNYQEIEEVGQKRDHREAHPALAPASVPHCSCRGHELLMRGWLLLFLKLAYMLQSGSVNLLSLACFLDLSLGSCDHLEFRIYFSYPFHLVFLLSLLLLYNFLSLKNGFWDRKLPELAFWWVCLWECPFFFNFKCYCLYVHRCTASQDNWKWFSPNLCEFQGTLEVGHKPGSCGAVL